MTASLPRRARLGIELDAIDDAGLLAGGAVPGSMGAACGVQRGDRVVAIDHSPLRSEADLAQALRRAGAHVALTIARGGVVFTREVACSAPEESLEGHDVTYGHVTSQGARLRTIVTLPRTPGPHPRLLWLQGITRDSVDFPVPIVHAFARAGLATMRIEKRGVGDSEGAEEGFVAELGRARRITCILQSSWNGSDDRVWPQPGRDDCAAARSNRAGPRRVRDLGAPVARLPRGFRAKAAPEARCERGQIAAAVLRLRASPGDRMRRFHEELHAIDLRAAWARVRCPVLVLHGEHRSSWARTSSARSRPSRAGNSR